MTDYAYLIARLTRMGLDYDIDWSTNDQKAYPHSVYTKTERWWFAPDGSELQVRDGFRWTPPASWLTR